MVGPKSGVYRAFRYSPCVRICVLKTILAQKKHMSSISEETRAERANIIRDALKGLKKKGTSVREIVRITHSTNSVIRGILAGKTPNPNSMIPLEKWAVEKGLLKEGSPPPEPVDLRSAREIGEIIAAIRKRRGMNQEAFAAAIGRGDQGQVSRWENGHEVPGDAILQAIANFAGENVRIFHKPRPARSVHELWPDNLSVRSTLEGGAVREERAGYGATSTIGSGGRSGRKIKIRDDSHRPYCGRSRHPVYCLVDDRTVITPSGPGRDRGHPFRRPTMKRTVITYSTPRGLSIALCQKHIAEAEKSGQWYRDWRGEEYCQVSHGRHSGTCAVCDGRVEALVAH